MEKMPQAVVDLLDKALVAELTVIDSKGLPRTDPLIPLWDGEHVLMTSSVLFSRKLQDLKRNPRVADARAGKRTLVVRLPEAW